MSINITTIILVGTVVVTTNIVHTTTTIIIVVIGTHGMNGKGIMTEIITDTDMENMSVAVKVDSCLNSVKMEHVFHSQSGNNIQGGVAKWQGGGLQIP